VCFYRLFIAFRDGLLVDRALVMERTQHHKHIKKLKLDRALSKENTSTSRSWRWIAPFQRRTQAHRNSQLDRALSNARPSTV